MMIPMISFSEYQSMGQSRKASILFSEGVPLGLVRYTPRVKIELYALSGFYVEIFYDKRTEDPLYLHPFHHMEGLDSYLQSIHIEDAFETKNGGLWI
jgi:hypothetical protein